MKAGILFFMCIIVIIDVFMFAAIYQSLDNDWFIAGEIGRNSLTYSESLWASINFASLLGSGTINPASSGAQAYAGVQTALTFISVAFIAAKTLSGDD